MIKQDRIFIRLGTANNFGVLRSMNLRFVIADCQLKVENLFHRY